MENVRVLFKLAVLGAWEMANKLIQQQRNLTELGIIRVGEKVPIMKDGKPVMKDGKPVCRPGSRKGFRITSKYKELLEKCQVVYGGELRKWNDPEHQGQYELLTETTQLKVLFSIKPTSDGDCESMSQWWEMRTKGGCIRRCDGCTAQVWECIGQDSKGFAINQKVEKDCMCDHEANDFKEQQAKGKACKLVTRFKVMLLDVPAVGLWRLNTGSVQFASEVQTLVETLQSLNLQGPQCATMTLEYRENSKGPGAQTEKFPVVVVQHVVDHQGFGNFVSALMPQAVQAIEARHQEALPEAKALKYPGAREYMLSLEVTVSDMAEIRAICDPKGLEWGALALQARELGIQTYEAFMEFLQGCPPEVPV